MHGRIESNHAMFTLDEKLDFIHVGNLQDRARFSTHFIHLHKIPPYPLAGMCRKCEEMSCFGTQDM